MVPFPDFMPALSKPPVNFNHADIHLNEVTAVVKLGYLHTYPDCQLEFVWIACFFRHQNHSGSSKIFLASPFCSHTGLFRHMLKLFRA